MVCKLGNVEQVTDQLTHHLTGVVLTVIGKGQFFIVFKKLFSHIAFHFRSHNVSLAGDVVFAQALYGIHHKQNEEEPWQCS